MPWIACYQTWVGKKVVMAVSGIVLFGYVVLHLAGNLKLYSGPEAFNLYASWIRTAGYPLLPHESLLWLVRLILLVALLSHIWAAVELTLANRRARTHDYVARRWVQTTYAARTMRWSGVLITLFIIYHLLHFTTGNLHPDFKPQDVYHNVVTGFRAWGVSGAYIAAQAALGLHLYHGLWSLFQTLGISYPTYNFRNWFAAGMATLITVGNISFPLAVLAGWVR